MTYSDGHDRTCLRAKAIDAVEALREVFPLQRRIAAATPPVLSAYVSIVSHWHVHGTPPGEYIKPALLEALVAMDAVVPQRNGLGCYPFSADPTDFVVCCADGKRVHAFCAIDALAIPGLLRSSAQIMSRCASCGQRRRCGDVSEDGSLAGQRPGCTAVIWEHSDQEMTDDACCKSLCRRLRFICATCSRWIRGRIFTLPQAGVIANAFFSFQRRMTE